MSAPRTALVLGAALLCAAPAAADPPAAARRPVVAGFYVDWDESSFDSLRRNLGRLDWVIPEWIRLRTGAKRTRSPLVTSVDRRVVELVRKERPGARLMPLVQNYHDGIWDGRLVGAVLSDRAARGRLVAAIASAVGDGGFDGVVIDFEEIAPRTQPSFLAFLRELRARLAPRGKLVGEAVPFDDGDWPYAKHAAAADHLFLMAYDEHWSTGEPGPVASLPWFEAQLRARLRALSPARTVVCIGDYGYDWGERGKEAEALSFEEATRLATRAKAPVRLDPSSRNPTFEYRDEARARHHVWFLDATTARDQVDAARRAGVLGFAIWRLGGEDPGLWRVLGGD